MDFSNLIGVLIVTHNAHDNLKIILDTLANNFFEIVVADSSQNLWGLSNKYPIKYYHCPNLKMPEKLRIFSKKISSEFILIHPDGEVLNLESLYNLKAQLQNSTEFISSTVSQNLSLVKQDNMSIIRPRNYIKFVDHSKYCIEEKPNLEQCLNPYHQMIWGLHRASLFKQIIDPLSNIDWEQFQGQNVTLFERAFNVFMHKNGRVLVSTLPLFLRNNALSEEKASMKIQNIETWHTCYIQESETHRSFLLLLSKSLSTCFRFKPDEVKIMLLRAIKNEISSQENIKPSFLRRIIRKILKLVLISKKENYNYENKNISGIRVEVECKLMTNSEFNLFVVGLYPFLLKYQESIKAFNK
ncbi:hypothetical protein MB2181_05080 [Methylophilales bacterium HTCC2181]|uniref:Uncharacterized protein n=1 Tax=Methylophilales bacterium HTCC2181 TaxID=383631 RepID=A0P7B3_9PROT|nr:hypothetical protein MB2181_05080 [Methylophilales bacterium HTCC2181]